MLKTIVSCFSFVILFYLASKSLEHFKTTVNTSTNVTTANNSKPDKTLENVFSQHCGPNIATNRLSKLNCYCKYNKIFKFGCNVKVEILNDEPLIVILHGLFKDKLQEIITSANSANFKTVRLGSEYGFNKISKLVTSQNGVLESNSFATKFIYDRLFDNLQIVTKCDKMMVTPKSTVVKYKRGDYFGVHYDANNYTLENSLGPWLGGRIFRGLVESLETCRHRYNDLNIWFCMYKLFTGQLQKTEYWDTSLYGPRLLSCLVQLSDVVGGETFFPVSNVAAHTKQGDMLIWANVNDKWNRYDASMHGGCPVLSEEKLIVVVFIPGKCNTLVDINNNLRK